MKTKAIRYKVRRGDVVTVLAGRDKGKSGKVLKVLPKKGTLVVERVNVVKRHTRPNPKNQQGGIVEKESPIAVAKVMVLDPRTSKPSRLGRKRLDNGELVRVVKATGEMIEAAKA